MDHRQFEHRQEAYGQFLEPCPNAATFLEPADTLLNHRATPIALGIEVPVLVAFVRFPWDHRPNMMGPKPVANAPNAVSFVTRQASRTLTRSAQWLGDADATENRFELCRLMLLSGRYFGRQRHACTVSDQVEFAAESAF